VPQGGLPAGQTAAIEGPPGAGTLALAASFAGAALARGEPVVVVDGSATALPHAWLTGPDDTPALWIVAPPSPSRAWPALDILLRSGGFGLIIGLDAGPAPRGAGGRVRRLLRDRRSRLVLVGEAPFTPNLRLALSSRRVEWDAAPTGGAPSRRLIEVRCSDAQGRVKTAEVIREDVVTDRLRSRPRAPDRRPSSKREGAARRKSGRGGRR
jgi:hypothetical protein